MQKPTPKNIPPSPGVYVFSDRKGVIVYVGKAKNLRKRVVSYFRADVPAKTKAMLLHADVLKTFITETEKEALLLEASLIKKHRPRYNIVFRDDKDHILFRIDSLAAYPRLEIVRRLRPGRGTAGKMLFGPFSSAGAARETWKAIHKVFPLRRCPDRSFANRARPCLYHHMGQCLGPCVLDVDKERYASLVRQVTLFLKGKSGELLDGLRREMLAASEAMEFEQAAVLRDRIRAVERTVERQAVVLGVNQDMDVLGTASVDGGLALCVLFVRGGVLLDNRAYFWPDRDLDDVPELLESFLVQFYQAGLPVPPKIVAPWFIRAMTKEEPDTALAEALGEIRGGSVHLLPPKGAAEESLVNMAVANAKETRRQPDRPAMAGMLAAALSSPRDIARIEAVDVSHTGGAETRAGMVVFVNEKPEKSAYRTYAVATGGDDFAALYQWAKRRARTGEPWPDLLLVDGGRGQVAAVARAFAEEGVENAFILAGIAKARTEEGKTDRRAGNDADRIFLPGRSNPLPVQPGSAELFFLQHVRDTAHDFAIGRHRKARTGRALAGELLRIPGVGQKTAKILWEHFGSLKDMAEAEEKTLTALPGIGPAKAAKLAGHLGRLHNPPSGGVTSAFRTGRGNG